MMIIHTEFLFLKTREEENIYKWEPKYSVYTETLSHLNRPRGGEQQTLTVVPSPVEQINKTSVVHLFYSIILY